MCYLIYFPTNFFFFLIDSINYYDDTFFCFCFFMSHFTVHCEMFNINTEHLTLDKVFEIFFYTF